MKGIINCLETSQVILLKPNEPAFTNCVYTQALSLNVITKTNHCHQALPENYDMLWIKAFHIIAVICWFAGIFYLPRLFVYHAMSQDQISKDRFVLMERKLLNAIMNPSAFLSIALGAYLLMSNRAFYQHELWMHIKLLMVFLLMIFHGYCIYFAKQFAAGKNQHNDRFYRIFNEIPVPILIIIIIMVVVRPL